MTNIKVIVDKTKSKNSLLFDFFDPEKRLADVDYDIGTRFVDANFLCEVFVL